MEGQTWRLGKMVVEALDAVKKGFAPPVEGRDPPLVELELTVVFLVSSVEYGSGKSECQPANVDTQAIVSFSQEMALIFPLLSFLEILL